ncbi:MAG: efflux RND transporter periplasmic adaptor subunit [Acidobacteria bacterium]|jgi:HlyD family secretion protein|nr:efflux RND transporter periplasmic adaptor subunit [Acidobacteriota bacterium]
MRKGIVGIGALVLVVGVAAVLYSRSVSSRADGLATVAVTRGSVAEKALAIGTIGPEKEIAVKSKISGIVKTSFREVGDIVKAGDPLFEIVPDPTPLELTQARREVEIATNTFEQTSKKHARQKALNEQGILPGQDWDLAVQELEDARIRLDMAAEKLALIEKGRVKSGRAQRSSVESIIRAPTGGMVLELLVNEGDPVVPLTSYQAGTALTTLADMSALIFKGTVDEIDVGKLREGMDAQIKIGALPEADVRGQVDKIAPKSKTEEGATLFDVEITLRPVTGVTLRAGYSANAEIVVQSREDVLLLPERLVTFTEGQASVEVPGAREDDPPVKKDVAVGLSDALNIEVTEGLAEGDLVIERPPKQIS